MVENITPLRPSGTTKIGRIQAIQVMLDVTNDVYRVIRSLIFSYSFYFEYSAQLSRKFAD
jgi:hypothetical protein